MANSLQETLREVLISALEGAGNNMSDGKDAAPETPGKSKSGIGGRGLAAAGVGMAALAPVAVKGLNRLAREAGMDGVKDLVSAPGEAVQGLGGAVGSNLGDKVTGKIDEAGGPSGILSDTVKDVMPFGGGDGGTKGGGLGVGKGRRIPVQQSIDIAAPLETVYNQWTQFEDWPQFMHRVVRATQDEDNKVSFEAKIWTRKREFTAEIETQRPDERIKWKVVEGMTHAGVVSFHELGPNLTRVLLSIDVQPGGMIEKMARGMRHVKRAARGDLHRFKAYIEMAGNESGAWRGVIEDGEVVEEHDPDYDENREYSDPEAVVEEFEDTEDSAESDDDDGDDSDEATTEDEDQDEEEEQSPKATKPRRRRQSTNGSSAQSDKGSPRSRSKSASRSGSTSRSGSSRSASTRQSSGGSRASGSSSGRSRSRSRGSKD
jgi:hypothetical protein